MTALKSAARTIPQGVSQTSPSLTSPSTLWHSADKTSALYQGDSFALMRSMRDASIDCIWTDPPYLLSNDGITCQSGRMVKVNKGEWDRSQGTEKDHAFNSAWLSECYRLLKPNGSIWVSGTAHVYFSVGMAMAELGFRLLNDIIWEKTAPPPNLGCRCFTHATEILLWATKAKKGGKDKHTFHYDAMRRENGGKQMKNVWRMNSVSAAEKEYGKHPTQKPVALIARCLRASTDPGDTIFDPFAGASTTGVAALTLDRKFIGCESSPEYAELGRKRLDSIAEDLFRG